MSEQTETQAPIIDPETGWDRRMVAQMAESIRIANEVNPRSWALIAWKDQPVLSVGFLTSGSVGPTLPYGLVIDSSELDASQSAVVERLKTDRSYKDQPWADYLLLPKGECADVLKLLKRPHELAIRTLASEVKSVANRWKDHREDYRQEFERILEIGIPAPAYLGEIPVPVPARRYWKISPGSFASEWKTFRERGIIAMHWSDDPIDLSTLPTDESGFKSSLSGLTDIGPMGKSSLWKFTHVMEKGDKVLAYGNKTIVGQGTVTGGYLYAEDDLNYRHRRPVNWNATEPRPISVLSTSLQARLMANATLIELNAQEYEDAIGNPTGWKHQPKLQPLLAIRDHFSVNGLHYTPHRLRRFTQRSRPRASSSSVASAAPGSRRSLRDSWRCCQTSGRINDPAVSIRSSWSH